MNNGHLLFPKVAAQQPTMQIAAPLNDVQLIALIASRRTDVEPKAAVEWAAEIVIEAILQAPDVARKVRERQQAAG